MVNIHLKFNDQDIHMLSIPLNDIQRLSVRPLKWLRFVTFTVCGVQGDLSETPNGCPVNYDTSLAAIIDTKNYYYTPQGNYQFIDYNALNDQITNSAGTLRSSSFRHDTMIRDGQVCVFTGSDAQICDAAHLIPKAKGDAYIAVVLEDRCNSYPPPVSPSPELSPTMLAAIPEDCHNSNSPALDLNINSVENGIFLRKDLHASFGIGATAFLKSPNFALNCDDIPRVEVGPMPSNRLTLQHLTLDTTYDPIPQRDARIAGTGVSQPPSILLDFMYGVAAYSNWGSTGSGINNVLKNHYDKHYGAIPAPIPQVASDSEYFSQSDDDFNDGDYIPPKMFEAMDRILALSSLIKGTMPELKAPQREQQEEAVAMRADEDNQNKINKWQASIEDFQIEDF